MKEENLGTEAAAIADLAGGGEHPRVLTVTDAGGRRADVVATRDAEGAWELHGVKPLLDVYNVLPDRRRGSAMLSDLASFVAHVNRFKSSASAIFADDDRKAPRLVGVLDYHPAGGIEEADWCGHRAIYTFPLSDAWKAWIEVDRRPVGQQAFAEWVEARILDIADPAVATTAARATATALGDLQLAAPARLLDLSRGLALRAGVAVKNVVNLQTGEMQVGYVTEHTDASGAPLKVPGAFVVAIQVFRGGALYHLVARLRYRLKDGSLSWFYELHGAERVFDHAFAEAIDTAGKNTGLPVFVGTPEAAPTV